MWAMLWHIDTAALGTLSRASAHSGSPCAFGTLRVQLAALLSLGGSASNRADSVHPIPPMAPCFAALALVTRVELDTAFRSTRWVKLAASVEMSRLRSHETVGCFGRDPDRTGDAALDWDWPEARARIRRPGAPVTRRPAQNPRAGANPDSALCERPA